MQQVIWSIIDFRLVYFVFIVAHVITA